MSSRLMPASLFMLLINYAEEETEPHLSASGYLPFARSYFLTRCFGKKEIGELFLNLFTAREA